MEIDFHTSVKAEQSVSGSLRKGKQDLTKCSGMFITRSALVGTYFSSSADFFRADVSERGVVPRLIRQRILSLETLGLRDVSVNRVRRAECKRVPIYTDETGFYTRRKSFR